MLKKAAAALSLASAAVLVTACGLSGGGSASGDDPGVDTSAKTVTVGAFVPETGPVPSYKLIAEGAKAYFDYVNAHGGFNGYKVTYKQVDDGYDPARSLANTKQLVQSDHVFALVAPIGTPTNAAVQPYAVQQQLPVIGPVGGDPSMATQKNYYALLPSYTDEAKLDTTYGVQQLHDKRVAILYENDDLGQPALQGAEQALKTLGLTPVTTAAFNVSDTDLTAQITKAKQVNADLTIVWGSNGNVATAVTEARRLGFHTQFFAPFYTADPSTYQLADSALDGTMFGSWLLPTTSKNASVQQYLGQMRAEGESGDIGVFSLNGWTNAALFGTALKQITANEVTPTRAALLNALAGYKNVSVGGAPSVTFTANNHVGTNSESILKAVGGAFSTITSKPIPFS